MEWRVLAAALSMLAELRGPELLRVKGLARITGCAGPVVVQGVQHLLHPPLELAAWPGAPATRLTIITGGALTHPQVAAVLDAVLGLG
jgi:G3E family GTPase